MKTLSVTQDKYLVYWTCDLLHQLSVTIRLLGRINIEVLV